MKKIYFQTFAFFFVISTIAQANSLLGEMSCQFPDIKDNPQHVKSTTSSDDQSCTIKVTGMPLDGKVTKDTPCMQSACTWWSKQKPSGKFYKSGGFSVTVPWRLPISYDCKKPVAYEAKDGGVCDYNKK